MDEEVVHTYDGILFSHEKSEILPFVTWVEPEGIMRSEISQTEKDKYHTISLPCGYLKNKTKYEQTHI